MEKKCKGLVMEATSETLVVMTPTGEFIKVPWEKKAIPALGSEIEFKVPQAKQSFSSPQKLFVLAASIVFFLLAIPFVSEYLYLGESQVIAYVSIDINPSLELGIDKESRVKEARGLNKEGEKLLERVQYENLPVNRVIECITQEAVQQQYLTANEENNIILTVSTQEERERKLIRKAEKETAKNTEVCTSIKQECTSTIKKELDKQKIKVAVEVLEISSEFYQKAKKAGVSPGKYAVILEARQQGYDVSIEDVKFSSVVKVIKAAGGNPGEIISRAKKKEKQLLEIEKEMQKEIKKEEKKQEKKAKQDFKQTEKEQKEKSKDKKKNKHKDKK